MQTGKWTCGFFLVAAAVMAQTAAQNGKKLSARELFYAEGAPAAPAKPATAAKPAPRPVPAKPAPVGQAARPATPAPVEQAARPATPPPAAPARTSGGASGAPARTAIVPVAYSPTTEKPLGLRYSFLRNAGGDEYREVDPDTVFHSGDRIRVAVQSNDEGYLYIVMKGTSGSWKVLFPSAEIAEGSNRVGSGRQTLIPPPPGRFAFDEQAGEERLFIVLARNPEPSLEKLIYSLGSASHAPAASAGQPAEATEAPKHLMMAQLSPVDDALVGRLRNQVYARDLVFEKVDDSTPGEKKEKAVYVVNPTGSPESRLVADVTLKHQ
jgi:hypothetical protein